MAQKTVRLDDCEEEESEGTREARTGRGGGEEEKEETRGQETGEEKMEKDVERGGEKGEEDAQRYCPQDATTFFFNLRVFIKE